MLQARSINLEFGSRSLFDDISFNLNKDQKIGLVGRNGCGKSTLLRVIAGIQDLNGGEINIQRGMTIAYLPQDVVLVSKRTIIQEAMTAFGNLVDLKQEYDDIKIILDNHSSEVAIDTDKLDRFSVLQQELDDLEFEKKIIESKQILQNLGFKQNQFDQLVTTLSVGWKMRLVLARLLLEKADFYLLDEPTNHLDIVAKDWFLSFLKNAKFGFLFVSHDRYFLDHACDFIFELENGKQKIYRGNYSIYLDQKERDLESHRSSYIQQQKMIKKKRATIERFRAKASKSKMAKSMEKELNKIEIIELSHGQRTIRLNFPDVKRSGKIVLRVKNLSKAFGEKQIFKNVSFELNRTDKAAIVAANGVGKTTLLNLITGKYELENGEFNFGHNVKYALFEQDQIDSLNQSNSIFKEIEDSCKTSEQRRRVRTLLGTFLFSGDDVDKKISVLSGGEKNRVAMVKVLIQDANFLILDEPTNHLDIQSREILLQALKNYPGTILFVSHDRQFIDGIANKVLELDLKGIASYSGNYEDYLYQKKQIELQAQERLSKGSNNNKNKGIRRSGKEHHEFRKELRRLESKIERLEKEYQELNRKFEFIQYGTDEFDSLSEKLSEIRKKIDVSLEQWEKFQ